MKYIIYILNGSRWMPKIFGTYQEAESFKVWAAANGYETTAING